MAADVKPATANIGTEQDYRETVESILSSWSADPSAHAAFLQGLHLIEPFSTHPDIAQKVAKQFVEFHQD
jgi:hypothetical protein